MVRRPSKTQLTAMTRTVERYLEYLDTNRGVGTGKRSPEWRAARLEQLKTEVTQTGSFVKKLKMVQRIQELEAETTEGDPTAEFVEVAFQWAEHNNISYEAFRELGVPARVLKEAGL